MLRKNKVSWEKSYRDSSSTKITDMYYACNDKQERMARVEIVGDKLKGIKKIYLSNMNSELQDKMIGLLYDNTLFNQNNITINNYCGNNCITLSDVDEKVRAAFLNIIDNELPGLKMSILSHFTLKEFVENSGYYNELKKLVGSAGLEYYDNFFVGFDDQLKIADEQKTFFNQISAVLSQEVTRLNDFSTKTRSYDIADRVHHTVGFNDVEALQEFSGKFDVNCQGKSGHTPLQIAAINNAYEAAQWLLKHGANSDISDNNGDTPLLSAAHYGHANIAKLIVDHATSVHVEGNNNWHNPPYRARKNGHVLLAIALEKNEDKTWDAAIDEQMQKKVKKAAKEALKRERMNLHASPHQEVKNQIDNVGRKINIQSLR